jgi:hypothetical protein
MTMERLTIDDFKNASPQDIRKHHLAIRCGEVVKEVPFKKIVLRCGIVGQLVVRQHL